MNRYSIRQDDWKDETKQLQTSIKYNLFTKSS